MNLNNKTKKYSKTVIASVILLVVLGVLLHDTKFDKAFAMKVFPISAIAFGIGLHILNTHDSSHTHVEITNGHNPFATMPRTQMKNGHRRFSMPKSTGKYNEFMGTAGIVWPSV